jgi:hypothetical protein
MRGLENKSGPFETGTMNRPDHFPSIRLAAAGCLSLLLLFWVGLWDDASWRLFISVDHGFDQEPYWLALTVGLAISILIILIPVLWRGPVGDRWLAALLAVFPLSLFAIAVLAGLFWRSTVRI